MNLRALFAVAVAAISPAALAAPIIVGPPLELDVYQNSLGQLIATAVGKIPACGLVPTNADPTFTIAGTVISVKQPVKGISCTNPPPDDAFYIASVNFGRVFDGVYTVNWDHPALTATYTVSGNPGISAAFSGNWFDPNQNGQGFEIEILGGATPLMSVLWFTFAPTGGETWIAASGPVSGTHVSMDAYQISGPGALFPPQFDAARVSAQPWGSLTFTFSDCNTGRVDWVSTQPGYGSGTMALTRLTQPDGLGCP